MSEPNLDDRFAKLRLNWPVKPDQDRIHQNRSPKGKYRHPSNKPGGSLPRQRTQPRPPPKPSSRASRQTPNQRAPIDMIRLDDFSGYIEVHPDIRKPLTAARYDLHSSTVAPVLVPDEVPLPRPLTRFHAPSYYDDDSQIPPVPDSDLSYQGLATSSEQNVNQMLTPLLRNNTFSSQPRNLSPSVPLFHRPHSLNGAHTAQLPIPSYDQWDQLTSPQYEGQGLHDEPLPDPESEFDDLPYRPRSSGRPTQPRIAIGLGAPCIDNNVPEASQYIPPNQAVLSSASGPTPGLQIDPMPAAGPQVQRLHLMPDSSNATDISSHPQQQQLTAFATMPPIQSPTSYPPNDIQHINAWSGPIAYVPDAPAHLQQHYSSAFAVPPPLQLSTSYVPFTQRFDDSIRHSAYAPNVPAPAQQQEQASFTAQPLAQPPASHFQTINQQFGSLFNPFAHARSASTQQHEPMALAAQAPAQSPARYFQPGNQGFHALPGPLNQAQTVAFDTQQRQPTFYAAPNADGSYQLPQYRLPMSPTLAASLLSQDETSNQSSTQHQQPALSTAPPAIEFPPDSQSDNPLSRPFSQNLSHQPRARHPRPASSSSSSSTATVIAPSRASDSRQTPSDQRAGNNAKLNSSPEALSTHSSPTPKKHPKKKRKGRLSRKVVYRDGSSL